MIDMNELHHGHIVVGLRAEASNGDSTCSQLAEDAADYIELLEYYLRCESTWQPYSQKLEAALRKIAAGYETEWSTSTMGNMFDVAQILSERINIARKALEGKDD